MILYHYGQKKGLKSFILEGEAEVSSVELFLQRL